MNFPIKELYKEGWTEMFTFFLCPRHTEDWKSLPGYPGNLFAAHELRSGCPGKVFAVHELR